LQDGSMIERALCFLRREYGLPGIDLLQYACT